MPRIQTWLVLVLILAASAGIVRRVPVSAYAANPPSASNSTVQAEPSLVATDGQAFSTISVRLLDANNAPVVGDGVSLNAALAGGGTSHASIPPPAIASNAVGVVSFTVDDTVAETVQYTALDTTAGVTLLQTATVSFVPPNPYGVSITPSSQSVDTGGQFTASVNAIAPGPGVAGITASVAYDSTAVQPLSCTPANQSGALCNVAANPILVTALNLSGYSGTTDLVDIVFKAVGPSGAQTWLTPTISSFIDASGVNLPPSFATPAQVTLMTPVSAANSTVAASGRTRVPADGSSSATIVVNLFDAASPPNPLAGKSVTLSANGGHSQVTSSPQPAATQGTVIFSVTDKTAETVVYTAVDTTDTPTITLPQQVTVTFFPGPASVANSSIVASPVTVLADGVSSTTITITGRDANGNPLAGDPAFLYRSLVGGGNPQAIVSPGGVMPAMSDSAGVATYTVTDLAVEDVVFTAAPNGTSLTGLSAQVNFVIGAPLAGSAVHPSNQSVSTISPGAGTITVSLIDANDHPVTNDQVTIAQTAGSQSVITPAVGMTNSLGAATFTVTDLSPETVTYTLTAANPFNPSSPVVLTDTPQVIFIRGPASATTSTVTTSATTLVASATITVTVRDADGNLWPAQSVDLTMPEPGGGDNGTSIILPSSRGETNASGVATFTVTDTVAESVNYVPLLDIFGNTTLSPGVTVTYLAGPLSGSASSVTTTSPLVTADGVSRTLVVVSLRDSLNNPIAGDSVTLAQSSAAQSVIAVPMGTSDKSGRVFSFVTDTKAETVNFTAADTTAGTPISGSAQVTFAPGPAAAAGSTISPATQKVQANDTPATIVVVLGDVPSTIRSAARRLTSPPLAAPPPSPPRQR